MFQFTIIEESDRKNSKLVIHKTAIIDKIEKIVRFTHDIEVWFQGSHTYLHLWGI